MPTPALSPLSLTSFYDPYDGSVLQAKSYFYKAGTLDPITVFTDAFLAIPHAQPVLSGGSGRMPPVWIEQLEAYRVRTFDQYDVLLEDIDFLPGAAPDPSDPGGGGGGNDGTLPPPETPLALTLLMTGDMFAAFSNAAVRPGAVRCNGLTIGNVASGATERANADAQALFQHLWQQDAGGLLPVLPSRGSSSQGDWDANKQITLPDLRGRALVGQDGMGTGLTGRLTGAQIDAGAVSVSGCNGGRASITLAISQIPHHGHTLHDPGHVHPTHDPTHSHTPYDPGHAHSYDRYAGNTGPNWTYNVTPNSARGVVTASTVGAGTGVSLYAAGTGYVVGAAATGIWMDGAGGDPNAGWATVPFSLAQPFLTATWYMKL